MRKTNVIEFGIKRENEERRDGGCAIVFDPETQRYAVNVLIDNGEFNLFSGGVAEEEEIKEGVLREVIEESGLCDFLYVEKLLPEAIVHYYNTSKKVNRVGRAISFLVILKSRKFVPTKLENHERFILNWATLGEIIENWDVRNEKKDYDHWIYFMKKAVNKAIELGYDKTSVIQSF